MADKRPPVVSQEAVDDDASPRNQWTVRRRKGSGRRAVLIGQDFGVGSPAVIVDGDMQSAPSSSHTRGEHQTMFETATSSDTTPTISSARSRYEIGGWKRRRRIGYLTMCVHPTELVPRLCERIRAAHPSFIEDALGHRRKATGVAEIRPASNAPLIRLLTVELHSGEAEAIALALEMKADELLIDERDGRVAARE